MSVQSLAARAVLVPVLVLAAFLLTQLVHKADHAYASRRAAAGAVVPAEPESAMWSQKLHLDRGASPPGLLVQGWSTPEAGSGVWSFGSLAALRIPPQPFPGPANVSLYVEPFVAATRPFQRVRVRAGRQVLGEWRLTNSGTTKLAFQAPRELRGSAGELVLQLDLPDADAPTRHVEGAMDPRPLAIKLHLIEVSG